MKEASFYNKINSDKVQCLLCPHNCILNSGKSGSCQVRRNSNGKLISENYEQVCSTNFDPIEKKPLYHFFPGKTIFSVGSVGCNLHCKFCQNWEISQTEVNNYPYLKTFTPKKVIELAKKRDDNFGIAYTYNEPTVWFEYMIDIAKLAKKTDLKNVMVTNGFINPEPLKELLPFIDAFSIDLKAFSDDFYKKLTSSNLQPVLNSIKTINKHNKHFELTNLVIPGENDDEKEFSMMIDWITEELGEKTVLHISRYHPMYKMDNPATNIDKLRRLYSIATEKLKYVYLGNVQMGIGQDTLCRNCEKPVISRAGYYTEITGLSSNGKCKFCDATVLSENAF